MREGPPPPDESQTSLSARGRPAVRIARRGGKLVVALLAVFTLAATGYGWRVYSNLDAGVTRTDVFDHGPGSDSESTPRAEPLDGAIDILLVGLDSRTDAQGDPLPDDVLKKLHIGHSDGKKHTDTMILVHIPQDGESATAFSFPRDSYVPIAGGYGTRKLNSAYAYAYNNTAEQLRRKDTLAPEAIDSKANAAGRKNLINTIERFIGRPGMIDRYAEIKPAGFYHITKALGGITVCLKKPVHEKHSGIDLPAGVQEISGTQALAFVRQRYGLAEAGLGRVERQQAFLSGVAHKLLSADVLLNLSRLSELVSAAQKSVVLSEGWDLWEFGAQMRALSGGDIEFYTIPVEGDATIGGADVLRVDPSRVRSFIDSHLGSAEATPDRSPAGGGAGADSGDPGAETSTTSTTSSAAHPTESPPAADPITAGGIPCVD